MGTMTMTDANALLANLEQQVQTNDIDKAKLSLNKLKIWMLDLSTNTNDDPLESITIATNALELGVLLSVADDDLDAFARNMSQLKPYYAVLSSRNEDDGMETTTTSMMMLTSAMERKCHVLGLNLMHLLVDNRLSEFHAELELLSEVEASTPYVSFPITLERQLMVGSYDEVLNSRSNIPHASYRFFMDSLLETVRDAIADCIEVSFVSMILKDAATMMKFDSVEELHEYIQEKREDWIVDGDKLTFQPSMAGGKAADIPSMKFIAQSLSYATELERIV